MLAFSMVKTRILAPPSLSLPLDPCSTVMFLTVMLSARFCVAVRSWFSRMDSL